jgi:hypothetical protein
VRIVTKNLFSRDERKIRAFEQAGSLRPRVSAKEIVAARLGVLVAAAT